jgi:hypothetical protein
MSKKSILIIALIAVIVVVVGAAAYWTNHGQAANATTSDTKMAFYNNGSTWLYSTAVIENATMKNGSQQNIYVNTYLKPENGKVVLDLSKTLGYENEKLPAGTTLRVLAWRGLLSSTANGTSDLNLNLQGWSNTQNPQSTDLIYNMTLANVTVNQLPSSVTDNNLTVSSDINQYQQSISGITNGTQPIYEEYIINVDANGKVTITQVQPPTLCNIMAHII